jgi:hypothetical protein
MVGSGTSRILFTFVPENFGLPHFGTLNSMNKVAKVLVVFMAVASLSFMAFSAAVLLGGPNWLGIGESMTDYAFEVSTGEQTTYAVSYRLGEPALNKQQLRNPAEAVLEALKHQKGVMTSQEQLLDQQIQGLESLVADRKALKSMDLKALEAREAEFKDYLAQLNDAISAANVAIKEQSERTIALNRELGLHREDVLRLRDQLELVRADRDRLIERSQELEDILALLKGSIAQMQRRTEQLSKQQKYDETVGSN